MSLSNDTPLLYRVKNFLRSITRYHSYMFAVISGPSPPASESNGTALSIPSEPRQEPEKIRKWREEQKRIIEQKGEQELNLNDRIRLNVKTAKTITVKKDNCTIFILFNLLLTVACKCDLITWWIQRSRNLRRQHMMIL